MEAKRQCLRLQTEQETLTLRNQVPNKVIAKCSASHYYHNMTHRPLQSQSLSAALPAPSPNVLDIFVVWHPADSEGASICDKLFQHYHSDAFAGLAGSAVEVYGRSCPLSGNDDLPAPIVTVDGIVGNKEKALNVDPAQYSIILPFIDENLIRVSIKGKPHWKNYLSDIARLQSKCGQPNFHTLVLPILPKVVPDYSNSPTIAALMSRQGVNQGHIGNLSSFSKKHSIASEGELTRDLGQAIIQTLLKEPKRQDRLQIFISHSRSDIPKKDKENITPTGVVSKVRSWIGKTKLADFVDIRDIQPGDDWNREIIEQVQSGALLMVRTDHYSCREWTQREVLEAKKAEMPVVCLSALTEGEQRGSFLLDHVPTVAYPTSTGNKNTKKSRGAQGRAIVCAINRLIDEALRQALWRRQEIPKSVSQAQESKRRASNKKPNATRHDDNHGFDVAPARAPEPLMLTRFLSEHKSRFPNDTHLWLIHPDPPLLPPEHEIMVDLCTLASYERSQVHILTPLTFFAAGGSYGQGEPQLSTPNLALSRPLTGFTLGVSLSRNEDIKALGLQEKHLELVMAEVAQMMLLSGGCITYAGAVGTHIPDLTAAVLRVIRRYIEESKLQRHQLDYCEGNSSQAPIHVGDMFRLTVPCTSLQNNKTRKTLIQTSKTFASTGTVEILDKNGVAQSIRNADLWKNKTHKETSMALSKIRSVLPNYCDARLVAGGKTIPVKSDPLNGFLGDFPGIIEEALYAVRNKQPLFVAGGFGGAAALLAHQLEIANNIPIAVESLGAIKMNRRYSEAITEIRDLYDKQLSGLDDDDLRRLTTTQRASELAGLVIKGIAANR